MKKSYILILSLLLSIGAFADTITVKQDSTGDYTVIQDAIAASVDGDTVLVYPGTYYENIDFIGKNITIASLVLTTGDINYKYTTIINGNKSGSCVVIKNLETDAVINGFTLTNGSGNYDNFTCETEGGGVFIWKASASIYNCVIRDNFASLHHGGIECEYYSSLFLSGTSIFNNHAAIGNGGLGIGGVDSYIIFDSINRCSIYCNYGAGGGTDIGIGNRDVIHHIVLDTFSVLIPNNYYLKSTDINGNPNINYTYDIEHGYFNLINDDIYVDPVNGSNNNTGLSPDQAFSTISYALLNIDVDSVNRNTIYLAPGVYSLSTNNEKYQVGLKPFTNIVGADRDNVILDGEYLFNIFANFVNISNYSIKNLTMYQGGKTTIDYNQIGVSFINSYQDNNNVLIDSVTFLGGWTQYLGVVRPIRSNNYTIQNCEFKNTVGGSHLRLSGDFYRLDTMRVFNCKFIDGMPDYNNPQYSCGYGVEVFSCINTMVIVNSLFSGNNKLALTNREGNKLNLINCTFTNNSLLSEPKPSINSFNCNLTMYNCISYNNAETPIFMEYHYAQDTVRLEIFNSLIENGSESIYLEPGLTSMHYDDSNIEGDPLFYEGAEFPYNLSENSPCIDAGTLDIPDWIKLPETDLAGNPRIYGETIDMGAYEWNPTVGTEEQPSDKLKEKLLWIAPNPIVTSTVISAKINKPNYLKIEVFNNNGQRVDVIFDSYVEPGAIQTTWNCATNGNRLTSGIYHVVLSEDGVEKDVVKMVVR